MRDLIKATARLSWAMSLLGVKSVGDLFTRLGSPAAMGQPPSAALDEVAQAAQRQLGGELGALYQTGDRLQSGLVDLVFGGVPGGAAGGAGSGTPGGSPGGTPPPPPPVDAGRLDRRAFVVLGEGLAAGAADFALSSELQRDCFPAQVARQIQAAFTQTLIQPPGIGNLPGYQTLPVRVPGPLQSTVLEDTQPQAPPHNLAVPGFRVADVRGRPPRPPLVHRHDAVQTAANLILGLPAMAQRGGGTFASALDTAVAAAPSLALVALGYCEAVEAAVAGEPRRIPGSAELRAAYGEVFGALRRAGAEVVALNVPDPLDTAYVSTLEGAARVVVADPALLQNAFGLAADDLVTVAGLVEIGNRILTGAQGPLPAGSVLKAATARQLRQRLAEMNGALGVAAAKHGVHLVDAHALFARLRAGGVEVGSRRLTADYLGGLYSLNGYYPGKTGHALIANEVLAVLDAAFGAVFPRVDVAAVAATDPVAGYQPAGTAGPSWPADPAAAAGMLQQSLGAVVAAAANAPPPGPLPAPPAPPPPPAPDPNALIEPSVPVLSGILSQPPPSHPPARRKLELPPGRDQTLPLAPRASYFGDALLAIDCADRARAVWGSCSNQLFGGLAMMDQHLTGEVRLRFDEPQGDLARFEISFPGGLRGADASLEAPWGYKLPSLLGAVSDAPGVVSWGVLNLATGQIVELPDGTQLFVNANFFNTALLALIQVNPGFPQVPISFPGQWGSVWARFEQRPDGLLDFAFHGSTFLPLGPFLPEARFPLPFAGPTLEYASVPARGTVLHPHLHLSTQEPPPPAAGETAPEIPINTVREYVCHTHNTSFGDDFILNSPVLGGVATGRSQLAGRMNVQFGPRCGDTVPIAVTSLTPGGYLAGVPQSQITQEFPGQLYPGPLGYNAVLRFPLTSYGLDDVYILDDPWDLSVAAVDVASGRVVDHQLHRGFIGQDVFLALIRVEPRTPKASFLFRGPAGFAKGARGQTIYYFQGKVNIPYPPGFLFPYPNLANGFPAGPGSSLDPFFWVQAMDGPEPAGYVKRGGGKGMRATTGDIFSYRYEIPADPARHRAVFEYENVSLPQSPGVFKLDSLAWVRFSSSASPRARAAEPDTVTFCGWGVWSRAGTESRELATVQISTAPGAPYVGIQIRAGAVSNVDTKPPNQDQVIPIPHDIRKQE